MEWTIDYLEEEGIVLIKVSGETSWEESKKLSEEAIELGRRRGSQRFLVDNRNQERALSILQVDMLPEMLKEAGITAEDKMALVYEATSPLKDTHTFFRNTSIIHSLRVQIFTSIAEAKAWLSSETALSRERNSPEAAL